MASKLILVTLLVAAFVAAVSARPRYLAIPLEDIQFLRGPMPFHPAHHRVARQAPKFEDEPEAAASGSRSSGYGGNDYVDYGAYTGGYGAFGWYTDHPVGNSYNSGY